VERLLNGERSVALAKSVARTDEIATKRRLVTDDIDLERHYCLAMELQIDDRC
jgi:hypothetical protein